MVAAALQGFSIEWHGMMLGAGIPCHFLCHAATRQGLFHRYRHIVRVLSFAFRQNDAEPERSLRVVPGGIFSAPCA